MRYELGFIGAGNMAEAIAKAAVSHGVLTATQIIAADPSEARRQLFEKLHIATTDDNLAVVNQSRQIMLAVKPQTMPIIRDLLRHVEPDKQIIISIMAGISTRTIEDAIGDAARVIRVMPNTPLMVGLGMTGVALGADARPGDEELALQLFRAAGLAVVVEESAIDAITAVSGSGPAYLFYLAEAMEQAARDLGLGEHARELVRQTLAGAAALLRQSPEDAAELRRKVSSPGGTTEAAINHLESRQCRAALVDAIKAAHHRSMDLGR